LRPVLFLWQMVTDTRDGEKWPRGGQPPGPEVDEGARAKDGPKPDGTMWAKGAGDMQDDRRSVLFKAEVGGVPCVLCKCL
jgi:hypothetical protein